MEPEKQNNGLLTSWKEISAYLKCGVRSCIRWEKERGLPVHRMADAPGSRVFAYKHELDRWLADQLDAGNGEVAQEQKGARGRKRFNPLWLLLFVPALAGLYFLLRPSPGPAPYQTGIFNIITTEPASPGRMRVWKATRSGEYKNIWGMTSSRFNTVMHTTIASGDIDGDGITELAAPTYVKITVNRGEKDIVYYGIFVNFYKEGKRGLWKTTFYSEADFITEDLDFRDNQIILTNLDDDLGNEIVLKTATGLGVLDYKKETGEIKLAAVTHTLLKGKSLGLRAVAAARLDGSDRNKIVVTADEIPEKPALDSADASWLLLVSYGPEGLNVARAVPVQAKFRPYALGIGDVNKDGVREIYALAGRTIDSSGASLLLGWDAQGGNGHEILLPGTETGPADVAALAVGDLTFDPGDDILVACRPGRLLLYSWREKGLELFRDFTVPTPGVSINAVGFADTDSDNRAEIIVAGAATPALAGGGRFYLEVLGFRELAAEIFPKWKRVGGEAGEGEVAFFEIARK